MSAFSDAFFRSHEGNLPLSNVQVYTDNDTLTHLARFATVFSALADYKKGLMMEAKDKGWPLTRPLFWHYPQDEKVWDMTSEFMLGPDLLVAPVLEQGANTVDVYLPKGKWVHLWSCEDAVMEDGGSEDGLWLKQFDAPLGQPAVFYLKHANVGKQLRERLGITCLDEVAIEGTDSTPSFLSSTTVHTTTAAAADAMKGNGSSWSALGKTYAVPVLLIGLVCPILWYVVVKTFRSRMRSPYVALDEGAAEQKAHDAGSDNGGRRSERARKA